MSAGLADVGLSVVKRKEQLFGTQLDHKASKARLNSTHTEKEDLIMLNVEDVKKWMENFDNVIQEQRAYLSDLDTPIGDGDHGNNMARGMEAVMAAITDKDFADVPSIFKTIAMSLISKVGGASGPLYGTAFMEMAKIGNGDVKELIPAALAGIEKRGKAVSGEKTMVDVWTPASALVQKDALTVEGIDQAVESTKEMVATKGRASYVGDRSVGHIDPGAMSSGYLLKALLKAEG